MHRTSTTVLLLCLACGSSADDADSGTPTSSTQSTGPQTSSGQDSTGAAASSSSSGEGSSDASSSGSSGGLGNQVVFETTMGAITMELDPVAAPITSANFFAYVEAGFYDGTDGMETTIIHRVVPGFVIQGGGLTASLMSKPTMPAIVNESPNGLTNVLGAISMARTSEPDTATSQFFINLADNPNLDEPPGFAVFGSVIDGMDVVDQIAGVPTETMGAFENVPIRPIEVKSVTRM